VRVFEWIHSEKANHKIAVMCRVLGVSKSGYHAWVARPPSQRSIDDATISAAIEQVWVRSRRTYGAPRVHIELRLDHDIRCGRKRVARLMRTAGIEGVHRRKRRGLTRRDLNALPSSDLVERDFRPVLRRGWMVRHTLPAARGGRAPALRTASPTTNAPSRPSNASVMAGSIQRNTRTTRVCPRTRRRMMTLAEAGPERESVVRVKANSTVREDVDVGPSGDVQRSSVR